MLYDLATRDRRVVVGMAHPFMWHEVLKLFRSFAGILLLLAACSSPAAAQHRFCDPANEDCRDVLITHIRAETVRLDVAFWFMEDHWIASEVINRWRAGVPVRILMDTEANSPNPLNALRLAEFEAAGIPMRERTASGILHWKMMLFAGQGVVQFSGANYSSDAFVPSGPPYTNYVDEVIFFTSAPSIVNSFKNKFDDLWTNTASYTDYRNVSGSLTRAYPTLPVDPRMNFVPEESHFWRSLAEYRVEPSGIDVTMYRITDWRFSEAMIHAKQRGIPVRLLTEPLQYRDPRRLWHSYNVDLLYMNGIEIKHRVHLGLNHQKSVILRGLQKVIFGSSNWSSPSAEYQEEHNFFADDKITFDYFTAQFERKWNNLAGVQEYGSFTPLPPDRPNTPSPATGVQGLPTTGITLQWDGGPWAHRYDVYLGTHPAEMVVVANDVHLGPSRWAGDLKSLALGALIPGTTYYWRIVGRTMANMTAVSPTWTFRTAGTAPAPPAVTLVQHPYVQQVTSHRAVIVWRTRENGPAKVRYTPDGGDVMSTPAVTSAFSGYYEHVATLDGLLPGTTYTYDVLVNDRDLNSATERFTTAHAVKSDFNGDGTMDLLWQHMSNGYLAAWSLKGAAVISSDLLSPERIGDNNWKIAGTGDFNSDGKPDIVWQEQTEGWIGIWLMSGTTLTSSTTLAPSSFERVSDTRWKIAAVVDLNNDGKPDILWQEQSQGWLAAWLLDGLRVTASVGLDPERVGDTNWKVVGSGDMNGDGKNDLVWQNMSTGYLAAWLLNGVNLIESVLLSPQYVTDPNWKIAAVGDLNADGKPDLVWQDDAQGWLAIWFMNGTTLTGSVGFNPERVPDTGWKIVGPK